MMTGMTKGEDSMNCNRLWFNIADMSVFVKLYYIGMYLYTV